jgi:thiamine-monophosphate kinase
MLSEFDIIRTCFDQPGLTAEKNDVVRQGIGDDCALLSIPQGQDLAFSMDTLVENIHFPASAPAELIASRSLAVNLSDLAATGAAPLVFTLGLTIPEASENWLSAFASGLRSVASDFNCYLIGGDMSRGPLTISIQVQGLVARGKAILRNGAKPGDKIYVTETLGAAGLALQMFKGKIAGLAGEEKETLQTAFYQPVPRIKAAIALADYVSAGIDISDGLLADLGHICAQSQCAAIINLADVPVAPLVEKFLGKPQGRIHALSAGDDYELIFTVPQDKEEALLRAAQCLPERLTCIGEMTRLKENENAVICLDETGNTVTIENSGYRHFKERG